MDRMMGLLGQWGKSFERIVPITNGASGAFLYDLDGKFIAKYARRPLEHSKGFAGFMTEYGFYQAFSGKGFGFVPEVLFQTSTSDELLIVMRKYSGISPGQWNGALIKGAMDLCARINALDISGVRDLFVDKSAYGTDYDFYPLFKSYEDWQLLQRKFPEHLEDALLAEMYAGFEEIRLAAQSLDIPKTLCHGDLHPENFLQDGDQLILCDWQTVGIGRGIGDVAFFISRGSDMGVSMDPEQLIQDYRDAILTHSGVCLNLQELRKSVAATDFYVTFKFWAEHLQSSSLRRVMHFYDSMTRSYRLFRP